MSFLASSAYSKLLASTPAPFLYPCLDTTLIACFPRTAPLRPRCPRPATSHRRQSTLAHPEDEATSPVDVNKYDHLDPQPLEYTTQPFTDACTLSLHAGGGGHGCISFLREKYIEHGPPNGGDGGTGGNVYIQAVRGETSLHRLARRGIMKAGRGKNGQGGGRGGKRGADILITVPVGTVVREISRYDPFEEDSLERKRDKGFGRDLIDDREHGVDAPDQTKKWRNARDKWLLYPGTLPRHFTSADFPALPRPRKTNLAASQPSAPLRLDLSEPMSAPMLLAAGAVGGLGNPHFATKSIPRPKFGTKGDDGMRVDVQLELKLLADVGLVGLPNAGKSTLLRALTRSRARVGDWAFTTLSPNIGTVVLDSYHGRPPSLGSGQKTAEPRTNFTIADIPGLIEDAHLDRGLGLGFLRHIERAAVLAFVVDLSAGDAVEALKGLWKEIGQYEKLRDEEVNADSEQPTEDAFGIVTSDPAERERKRTQPSDSVLLDPRLDRSLSPLTLPPISSKPWLVVASKADLPETRENFAQLQRHLRRVQAGDEPHPSGKKNAWRKLIHAMPVSGKRKEGVEGIKDVVVQLLD